MTKHVMRFEHEGLLHIEIPLTISSTPAIGMYINAQITEKEFGLFEVSKVIYANNSCEFTVIAWPVESTLEKISDKDKITQMTNYGWVFKNTNVETEESDFWSLGLSIRTTNALIAHFRYIRAMPTIDSLRTMTPKQVLRVSGIGKKGLEEVEQALLRKGLSLRVSRTYF
jgi:hypothetical protein